MVVAEQKDAAQAGVSVLERGGNAVDAAVATALAVGVTNPVSCGLGGGGFMLIYMAQTNKVYALDYRERAPLNVNQAVFIRGGRPDEDLLRRGALAVAVPGEVAGLAEALRRFGRMKFSEVAQPAIALARDGFPCGQHLAEQISRHRSELAADPSLRRIFFRPDGNPKSANERIVEPELARTLEQLGDNPADVFYRGAVARELVRELEQLGGKLTLQDLAQYRPVWREPLARQYEGKYEVVTMPPPSAGGGLILEMLAIVEGLELKRYAPWSAPYFELIARVMNQAFADRGLYADPDFAPVPLNFLFSPSHLGQLRRNVLEGWPLPYVSAPTDHGTSQVCVVDAQGNIVSLTTTINTSFGAKVIAPGLGIILNNEMDDFALARGLTNIFGLRGHSLNLIEPGKRPLSNMAPTIVMERGRPFLVIGASGGPAIITSIFQVLLDILDFGLEPEKAVALPRIYVQEVPNHVVLEDAIPQSVAAFFEQHGYQVRRFRALGDVSAIEILNGRLYAGADFRKGGVAAGY